MVLRQVSLGRPLFHFPSGVQRRAILSSASGGIQHTILRIFRKYLFWKVCILWAILVDSFQHTVPYSKTLRTLLLKIPSLVLVPTCFDFQMFFSMAKDWLALVILELTSLSESPSVAILLPWYMNLFTSSMSLLFMVTGSFDLWLIFISFVLLVFTFRPNFCAVSVSMSVFSCMSLCQLESRLMSSA